MPEGLAGIFEGANRAAGERVYLRNRKGFVKVAIQAGTPILPVYHLGNSMLLGFVGAPSLSRRLRVSLGLFYGVAGTPLPHRHDMLTLVGDPLQGEGGGRGGGGAGRPPGSALRPGRALCARAHPQALPPPPSHLFSAAARPLSPNSRSNPCRQWSSATTRRPRPWTRCTPASWPPSPPCSTTTSTCWGRSGRPRR